MCRMISTVEALFNPLSKSLGLDLPPGGEFDRTFTVHSPDMNFRPGYYLNCKVNKLIDLDSSNLQKR